MARSVDQPIAALLKDLKARGLLDDTLVIWSTEFGRMPFTQGATGRDHNGGTFVSWLAGAGVQGGVAHGESDEWSWKATSHPTYCYDLHATILHLLGIDHERLTFRHNGIDRRLTDVHGHVIREIVA
jgi:arylsulfatase A-like enzyme